MSGALAGVLFFMLLFLVLFPRAIGKDARRLYDKFMEGWNR